MNNEVPLKQYQLFRQMLEMEYDDLERYIGESLLALKRNELEADQKYQDLKSRTQASWENTSFLYSHVTPYLLKHSLFISAYSFIEYSLKKFCEMAASQRNQYKRRVSNLQKIYQFYSFLTNEVQLDKQKTSEDWEKLNIFRDLRNCIVHYNSSIGKNISAKSYDFIKEDSRIQLEEPKGFHIKDDALILELIAVSKRFLFTLMDEYHQKNFLV